MSHPPPPPPFPQTPHNPYNPHTLEANGEYQMKPPPPILIVSLNIVNTVTQLLIGAVIFCAISFANMFAFGNTFSQHIYLCVIGYVLLMSQAILSFNPHAGWAYSLKYPEKKIIHAIMQILGSLLAIVGSVIRIVDSDEHFHTAHSITGIIALILTILSLIGGVLNFIFPTRTRITLYQTVHMGLGCLTISMAFICLCIAFNDLYLFIYGSKNANFAISCAVFALAGILMSAFARTFQRLVN